MSFIRYRGKTKLMYFKKTDTTLASSLRDGSLVGFSDSSNVHYLRNDSTDRVVGVCRVRVLATDTAVTAAWPTAPFVPVEVPVENGVEWIVDLDSDVGALDTDVGRYCSIDTAGGNSVSDCEATRLDINDTVQRIFLTTKVVSGSKVIGVIARSVFNQRAFDTTDN